LQIFVEYAGKLDKFHGHIVNLHQKLDRNFNTTTWWVVGGLSALVIAIIGLMSFK
jgi:hypothetical protein